MVTRFSCEAMMFRKTCCALDWFSCVAGDFWRMKVLVETQLGVEPSHL